MVAFREICTLERYFRLGDQMLAQGPPCNHAEAYPAAILDKKGRGMGVHYIGTESYKIMKRNEGIAQRS
jgi:hypothetical protein